ncbi:protein-L-isoaspartate(D-aspartate) O-methyltransferase [Promicromonospora umidemergens]|uniref:Protein-L-isoaspartate O-methyltransferase n=1 Tax=Promicromonospora umidemergens TaxID=629679 RepID=A0ABP8WUS8_9MICO|nr:methyltransferase, FxLD system [Promicromonospora umidemergens]MCP2283424.1 protein-L-isoaspartate(D-aspartate) O-methyltransferase [Promicromonospora umidemergens]
MTTARAWHQLNITFEAPDTAEQWATGHARDILTTAREEGVIDAWWYIRKHPHWRLRLHAPGEHLLDQFTRTLTAHTAVKDHAVVVYEPETYRFGGPAGMDVAHHLFAADSRHLIDHLAGHHGGDEVRAELAVRLVTRVMTAAGLELFEQGDTWQAVADRRVTDTIPAPTPGTVSAVQTLITAADEAPDSPLAHADAWTEAFEEAGLLLADLAAAGQLSRGLRAILADHAMFTFNRFGIPASTQALLARAASTFIFHHTHTTPDPTAGRMTRMPTTATDPARLREALVAKIDSLGIFRTPAVREAFLKVPRHVFLAEVDVEAAYVARQVVTKRAADGTATSSASSPSIVAIMLEQLDVEPGHNVLEIGAATGINAALLSELVGDSGKVTTIELDQDLADGAHAHLSEAGYQRVEVICGDGAVGAPDRAPFDRIIVTAGAWDIPEAWWAQLKIGGRLVVPLSLHGSGLTRSLAFERTSQDTMVATDAATCGFVPMRGSIEAGAGHVRLADEVILKAESIDGTLEESLPELLNQPEQHTWTGLHVRHDEPVAHLDLWLATHCEGKRLRFGKVSLSETARSLQFADPARRWSGATLYASDGTALVHLTTRAIDDDTDEIGLAARGHAPVIDDVMALLNVWNKTRPAHPFVTAERSGTTAPHENGWKVSRPSCRLTITW